MQTTQQPLEYGQTTNFVKFMQQTTLSLSENDTNVCNQHLLQFIYLMNRSKLKASAQNTHLWNKQKLADVYVIH